jgi:hypothetical protein
MAEFVPPTQTSAALPAPEARTFLSLAIFVHLFAISVGMLAYANPSPLESRLKRVFAPYLRTFNFDLAHTDYTPPPYYLTHATATDVDFLVQVEFKRPDGSKATIDLPAEGMRGERRLRYQMLANAVGSLAENGDEARQAILPQAIVAAVLEREGSTEGVVRCRAHQMHDIPTAQATNPARRDPNAPELYRIVYEADARLFDGKFLLVKRKAAGETAPVSESGQSSDASASGETAPTAK